MQTKTSNRIISSILFFAWMYGIFYMRRAQSLRAALLALVAAAIWFGLTFLPKLSFVEKICALNQKIWAKIDGTLSEATLFFNIWLISFFVFIPAWLAFFPGILGYDTPNQFAMYAGEIPFDSAQQPILHTLLIGGLISLGHAITGSYQAGLAVATAFQGLMISHCIAAMCIFLKRRNVSPFIIIAGLLITFLNPSIQVLNCNLTKDVLFGVFLTEFVMAYIDLTESTTAKVSLTVKTIVFGILLCLFRNGLVHAVFVTLIVTLIVRHKKKQIYIALASIIVFVHVFSFVADSAFGIKKSPLREFLAVPIQQLSHVVVASDVEDNVTMTEEEKERFAAFMPGYSALPDIFEYDTADAPKAQIDDAYLREHKAEFLKLYIQVGLKNPGDYFKTWRSLECNYFNINHSMYKPLMVFLPGSPFLSKDKYNFSPIETPFTKYGTSLSEKIDWDIPLIFQPINAFVLLGLLLAASVAFKKFKKMPVIFLLMTYFAGILIGPVALVRYAYPLMLMLPLLAGLFLNYFKNEENLPQ